MGYDMNNLIYDGSNYLAWKYLMKKCIMSFNCDLWDVLENGIDSSIRSKKLDELTSHEKKMFSLDKDAYELVFKCLDKNYKSMVSKYDISNANYLWKFIFDQYVDEQEYLMSMRSPIEVEIEKPTSTCLVGSIGHQKKGNSHSHSVENYDDDECVDSHACVSHNVNDLNDESSDNEDIDMSKEELANYAEILMQKLEKSNKSNRKLEENVKSLKLELSEKKIEIEELKNSHITCSNSSELELEVEELKKLNDILLEENIELIKRNKYYEQLQKDYDEMSKRVNDLSSSLEKLTLGKNNLEKLLGKQKADNNKNGLGFVNNCLTQSHASTTKFVKESNSLDSKKKSLNHAWKYTNVPKRNLFVKKNECVENESFYAPRKNVNYNVHNKGSFLVKDYHNVPPLRNTYMHHNHRNYDIMHNSRHSHKIHYNEYYRPFHINAPHNLDFQKNKNWRHDNSMRGTRKFINYLHTSPIASNAHLSCTYCGIFGHVSPKCRTRLEVEKGIKKWVLKNPPN